MIGFRVLFGGDLLACEVQIRYGFGRLVNFYPSCLFRFRQGVIPGPILFSLERALRLKILIPNPKKEMDLSRPRRGICNRTLQRFQI